jgi:hypothetical protein
MLIFYFTDALFATFMRPLQLETVLMVHLLHVFIARLRLKVQLLR